MGSRSCSIRLVCTIHASASDLSRKPGIRLHLPLRLFISTLNKSPFCGITRYAMLIMPASMSRQNWDCTADAITTSERPYYPPLNGIGLRTFSVLGIRIYVAGLYLDGGTAIPTRSCIRGRGSCSTSGFYATWMRRIPARHGRRASSKIASRRATLIPATYNSLSRRFHPYTRVMTRRCYSRRGAST
jgi:hypothetical protein